MNLKKYGKLVECARENFENSKYQEALEILEKAFEMGIILDDLNLLGFIYIELGKYSLAEDVFKKVLSQERNPKSYYGLGCINDRLGKYKEAVIMYEESIRFDDTNPLVLFDCAYLYDDLGNKDKSKYYYEKLLKINPDDFWGNINLGTIYDCEGNNEKALELFLKAYSIDPNSPMVNYNLGVTYSNLNNKELALKHYFEEIEKNNKYVPAYYNLALLYKDAYNDYEKAKLYYLEGLKIDQNNYLIWYNLGCLYALMKDYKNAYDCFLILKYKSKELFESMNEDEELEEFKLSDEYKRLWE